MTRYRHTALSFVSAYSWHCSTCDVWGDDYETLYEADEAADRHNDEHHGGQTFVEEDA